MPAKLTCYLLLINLLLTAPCFASPSERLLSQLSGTASPQATSQPTTDDLARYCLGLINNSRATEGHLQPVQQDSGLQRLAQSYADYMLKHPERYVRPTVSPHLDLEGHIPMDRARAAGITTEVHENLGMERRGAKTDYQSVARQHGVMMAEPAGQQHTHRAIILDSEARNVGIGVARDNSYLYLVEEFGH